MTITKPKQKPTAEAFISGAPDATSEPYKAKHVRKGKKLQVTLTITPALLDRVDELAAKLGQSRAAVINMAVYRMVEHGVTIDGLGV
ncbi:MAG: ribbon-helix-helix domain-containing protein [Telluria sp.]